MAEDLKQADALEIAPAVDEAGSPLEVLEEKIRSDWEARGFIKSFPDDVCERAKDSCRNLAHILKRFG